MWKELFLPSLLFEENAVKKQKFSEASKGQMLTFKLKTL